MRGLTPCIALGMERIIGGATMCDKGRGWDFGHAFRARKLRERSGNEALERCVAMNG